MKNILLAQRACVTALSLQAIAPLAASSSLVGENSAIPASVAKTYKSVKDGMSQLILSVLFANYSRSSPLID